MARFVNDFCVSRVEFCAQPRSEVTIPQMFHAPQITVRDDEEHLGATPLSRTMVPNAYGAVWCDVEDGSYWADPVACMVLGIQPQGMLSDACVGHVLAEVVTAPGGPQRYYTFRNHAGHVTRARLVPSRGSETVILVDDLQDITSRFFELKGREREYRELFENAQYGLYRATVEGRVLHANPALVKLNGYADELSMLDGMKTITLQNYVDPHRRRMFFDELNESGQVVDFISEVCRHHTGERIWISETAWLVNDEAGTPRYLAGTVTEITERMKYLERVKTAAETDALTGLANRAHFYSEIERCIQIERPAGATLFLIDCDRFKDINDIYGHARGDAVLRICAQRLTSAVPASAILARLGGDEFAVLIRSAPDQPQTLAIAARIAEAFELPIAMEGADHRIGASIGIARFPDHAGTPRDLLRNADLALYAVKDGGRGHARLFDEQLDRIKQDRHALERDLRDAHLRDELELFYQPIVNAGAARIVGAGRRAG